MLSYARSEEPPRPSARPRSASRCRCASCPSRCRSRARSNSPARAATPRSWTRWTGTSMTAGSSRTRGRSTASVRSGDAVSTEAAIFTAIPAGRMPEHGLLKVTVFVTPRLSTGAPAGSGIRLPSRTSRRSRTGRRPDRGALGHRGRRAGGARRHPAHRGARPGAVTPDPQVWEELFGATRWARPGSRTSRRPSCIRNPSPRSPGPSRGCTRPSPSRAHRLPHDHPRTARGQARGAAFAVERARAVRRGRSPSRDPRTHRRCAADLRPASGRIARTLPADRGRPAGRAAGLRTRGGDDLLRPHRRPLGRAAATAVAPPPIAPEFHSFVARCAD